MTTSITGGVVSIEDGTKKTEEYAPARKVRVELTFVVSEGSDDAVRILDQTAALADQKVKELLGAKPRSDKDKLAAAAGLPTEDLESARTKPAKVAPKTPSKAKLEPVQTDLEDALLEADNEESLDDLLGDASVAAVKVTDAELNAAVRKRNEALKAPAKIRDLIATYGTADKKITLAEIPQPKRQEFLAKLGALA